MRKKGDLSDFDHVMAVCVNWAHLAISEAAYVMGFSHTAISRVDKEWSEKRVNIQLAAIVWVKLLC